ncbi:MAG: response regulator [Planctomycetota bacterium]
MSENLKSLRILIADDSLMMQRLLFAMAQDIGFTDIHLAGDGLTAIKMFEQYQPQIALLDIVMPNLDGISVLKEIREQGSDCTVIMVSGLTFREEVVRCRKAGANGYLLKPFEASRIRSFLRRLAEKAYQQAYGESFAAVIDAQRAAATDSPNEPPAGLDQADASEPTQPKVSPPEETPSA